MSYFGQKKAAEMRHAIDLMNADTIERNAALEADALKVSAAAAKNQAKTNFMLRGMEGRARLNNAITMERQGESDLRVGRVHQRKLSEEGERLKASQIAAVSASGALMEGTPLDVLADTARQVQDQKEVEYWEHQNEVNNLFRAAALERSAGNMDLWAARQEKKAGMLSAKMFLARSHITRDRGRDEAAIARLSAGASLYSAKTQAKGNLFGGLMDAASSYSALSPQV